ncbi:DUF4287 domain-containing protein [Amycolatopsis sp. FDAARGOS 1241]|uniref:DUF4287 domain-containing protein n=1 Tax=Amycolatopsis sp. FDAARGOS 1241 TaxID=2778070 RepID=UPI0019506690|nr:DUF4287 domain-containing protein [Amycolatopsis sp. FDAARGOS 1241]QRP46072.1 DUF4287 domain-containing protein [Amycolatopsis sp. FDAARGOS 1241]
MGARKLSSDDAVRTATGRGWDEWGGVLDAWGARRRSHGEIAGWLVDEHGVGSWWAQTVTVEYERSRGMRPRNGGRDGLFTVNASRTVKVPIEELYRAVVDAEVRQKWLGDDQLTPRTTQANRSARFDWGDGSMRVNVGFVDKGTRAQVALAHERIVDEQTATEVKAYWKDRLAQLKKLLES